MANSKAKVKLKVVAVKGKTVKPTLGNKSGGLLSSRIVTELKKKQNG